MVKFGSNRCFSGNIRHVPQLLNKHKKCQDPKMLLCQTLGCLQFWSDCVSNQHILSLSWEQRSELAEAQPSQGAPRPRGSLLLQSGWPPIFYKVKFDFIPLFRLTTEDA